MLGKPFSDVNRVLSVVELVEAWLTIFPWCSIYFFMTIWIYCLMIGLSSAVRGLSTSCPTLVTPLLVYFENSLCLQNEQISEEQYFDAAKKTCFCFTASKFCSLKIFSIWNPKGCFKNKLICVNFEVCTLHVLICFIFWEWRRYEKSLLHTEVRWDKKGLRMRLRVRMKTKVRFRMRIETKMREVQQLVVLISI